LQTKKTLDNIEEEKDQSNHSSDSSDSISRETDKKEDVE